MSNTKKPAHNSGKTVTPDPTPEEIAAGCAAARAKWTPFQLATRNRYKGKPVQIKEIACSDAGMDPVDCIGGVVDREKWL